MDQGTDKQIRHEKHPENQNPWQVEAKWLGIGVSYDMTETSIPQLVHTLVHRHHFVLYPLVPGKRALQFLHGNQLLHAVSLMDNRQPVSVDLLFRVCVYDTNDQG
jgi:hypothetical protein